jgi:hypothetical protein
LGFSTIRPIQKAFRRSAAGLGRRVANGSDRGNEHSVSTQQAFVKTASGKGVDKPAGIRGHRPGEPKDLQIALKTCNEALSEVTCAGGNLIRPPWLPGVATTRKPMQVIAVPDTDSFCCQSDHVYIIL